MSTKFRAELHSRRNGSTEEKVTKDKNVENVPQLEITETCVTHGSGLHLSCSDKSTKKSFGQLLNISQTNNIYTEAFCL